MLYYFVGINGYIKTPFNVLNLDLKEKSKTYLVVSNTNGYYKVEIRQYNYDGERIEIAKGTFVSVVGTWQVDRKSSLGYLTIQSSKAVTVVEKKPKMELKEVLLGYHYVPS